ncbi:MAG TPA: response regulator transcription factor [Gaiellaceae bacterium]
MSLRILIVGPDPEARSGLRRVLGSQAAAVAEAADVGEAVLEARLQQPDLIVMDGVSSPPADAVRELVSEVPESKTLVVSSKDDPASVREAFGAGAYGYLLEGVADSAILAAVRALAAGESYVEPTLGARIIAGGTRQVVHADDDLLTGRQREVLRLLALGHTNNEIAEKLALSVRTIETHRAHLMQKLRITSRAGLVRYAMERGLLTD